MSWEKQPIASFALVGAGQGAPQQAGDFGPEGHPFVRAGSLERLCDGAEEDSLAKIPDAVAKAKRMTLYPGGTIVFAKSGMSATLGRVYKLAKPCYVVNHLAAINTHEGTDADFLAHYFRFSSPARLINDGAYPSIRLSDISAWEIPLPPLDEQKRIAAVLDKADALRRQRQESLQLTEKLLQSVFIDMFGDPGKNPMGFPECVIGDLLVSANYGTSAKASDKGTWPVLRMGNITYEGGWDFSSLKYMELDSKNERKYLVRSGEILFNRTNSKDLVGKTAVYREERPMAFAGYLIRCTVNNEADPEYISAFLNSTHGKTILRSMCKSIVGMANINAKELQSIAILKPPVALQRKFSEAVRSILRLRASIAETAMSDDALFSSIQQRAFRGELDLGRLRQ